ncbi:MAG: membrane protein insertion efficiency factor YidD [Ruminococcaceae bacterium]|nr:membrane protein insertion efficiency factor YidD [Oscillospiraceae bacterium]
MKKLIREIRVWDIIRYFSFPKLYLAIIWVGYALLVRYQPLPFNTLYTLPIFLLLSVHLIKRILIGAILLYKAFAPMEIRSRCRFKPTCSTYMIMALKKYGLFIGLIKGIIRILHCKPPYEGVDYP